MYNVWGGKVSSFEPENDNRRQFERRREPRRRALLKGKIVYVDNSFSADCTIRDLSPTGARILAAPEAIRGDPFLIVVKEVVVHRSRVAWRLDEQTGLQFVQSSELGGDVPLHLKTIQRLWAELAPR